MTKMQASDIDIGAAFDWPVSRVATKARLDKERARNEAASAMLISVDKIFDRPLPVRPLTFYQRAENYRAEVEHKMRRMFPRLDVKIEFTSGHAPRDSIEPGEVTVYACRDTLPEGEMSMFMREFDNPMRAELDAPAWLLSIYRRKSQ
jgi:hypothetical protein